MWLKKFSARGRRNFYIWVFLKANSTSAANRKWSAFVPLCRRMFIAIILRTRFLIFAQLALKYRRNSIPVHCTSLSSHSAKHQQRAPFITAVPLSDQSTLVSRSVVLRPSVRLSVTCLRFTQIEWRIIFEILWTL